MLTDYDLEVRKNRVTASNVSAFLAFHPWKTPSAAWELHTGIREFQTNDDVRLGEFLEPGLVQAVTTRLGWPEGSFEYPCRSLIGIDYPWAAATPDVLQLEQGHIDPKEMAGIQIKNQNPHMARGYKGTPGTVGPCDNTLIPLYMLGQCQWEMLVTGRLKWFFATYMGGRDLRIYRIWRNDTMLGKMIPKALAFWKEHIDPDGPQTRPDDAKWNPNIGKPVSRSRKLKGADLLNQPIPRSG